MNSISKENQKDKFELIRKTDGYYLYKHYSITDIEKIKELSFFSSPKLRYSLVDSFNDPFELNYKLYVDTDEYKKNSKFFNKKTNDINTFVNGLKEGLKGLSNTTKNLFYICCLNNNPLDILLWAHYADSHKGFVVEYKFLLNIIENDLPQPMTYSNNYPCINISTDCLDDFIKSGIIVDTYKKIIKKNPRIDKESLLKKLEEETKTPYESNKMKKIAEDIIITSFLNKSEEWVYESEFRAILPKDKYSSNKNKKFNYHEKFIFESLEKGQISSIILGVNCEIDQSSIRSEIDKFDPSVEIYKAELNKDNYGLNIQNHPRLSK